MTETIETKKPSFEMSIDTRMIYDRMKEAATGEVVSFKQISEALGRTVGGDCSNIQSAIRALMNEGVLFENIRGVGYKRLEDKEIVGTAERSRLRIRKAAQRAVKKLSCVRDFEALQNELKIKHNAAVSGFGAVAAMLTPGKMKKLEDQVEKAAAQLPLAKTLEVFKLT